MSNATTTGQTPRQGTAVRPKLGYLAGIRTVFGLEIKQRVRTRGWYIMLGIWFVLILLVAALAAGTTTIGYDPVTGADQATGQAMFELVIAFVLFFGLMLVPALSANSITGDRAAGTLAILQNTLLTPGQLLWGKWLAAWVAALAFLVVSIPMIIWAVSYGDIYPPAMAVLVAMLAVELGIICAIGVGVSAIANRSLFAIMASYLLIAMLSLGTLIGYGLSLALVTTQVSATEPIWAQMGEDFDGNWDENGYTCGTVMHEQEVVMTERVTWLLAANPFVVIADAAPQRPGAVDQSGGPMASISDMVRSSQAGHEYSTYCLNGVKNTSPLPAGTRIWPLGLGLQAVLAAGLLAAGYRRLRTPAGKLASGTRIA